MPRRRFSCCRDSAVTSCPPEILPSHLTLEKAFDGGWWGSWTIEMLRPAILSRGLAGRGRWHAAMLVNFSSVSLKVVIEPHLR